MSIEINEIKHIRKKLGLTQHQLAQRAQVSQSLIAKIESGRLDPTYSNAQKIFNALDDLSKKQEAKAEELMTDKIISVTPDDSIKEAISKMKRFNISQMPVIEEHKSIGLVSESTILEAMLNKHVRSVKEVMHESPPVVSNSSTLTVISNLLKFYPMVLVSENGKLKGVITRSDLLAKVYK
jgi:predicted transcriptional regulator